MFYLELFKALQRHNVRYVLVGGLAMNLHGVPRMTMDVDLMLALDAANLQGFFDVAAELRLKPSLPLALSQLADPSKREEWIKQRNMIAFSLVGGERNIPTVDVLIGVDVPFEEAYGRREIRTLSGVGVSLASLEDMLTLKRLAGRAQDVADIEHLEQLRGSAAAQ